MVYLKDDSARELTQRLLANYNLLVKDLTKKTSGKNYLHIAIRNIIDNNRLIEVLKKKLKYVVRSF